MEERGIIRNRDVLDMDFVPERVVSRDGQVKSLMLDLKPVLEGGTPRHSFLYGPPGTGKTCISRYVVSELSRETHILSTYVNCWKTSTRFNILYEIARQAGLAAAVHRKGTPVDELIYLLEKRASASPFVVILDEVDKIEEGKVLYDLLSIRGIVLVTASNNPHAFHRADPRVMSRLSSMDSIEFPAYSPEEILSILSDRAEWGLFPGVIDRTRLMMIARASRGDARRALETLRVCAEECERHGLESIPDSAIRRFISSLPEAEERFSDSLNPYHAIILDAVKRNPGINATSLFEEFSRLCSERGLEAVVDRTFRKHTSFLLNAGRLRAEKRGKERAFFLRE